MGPDFDSFKLVGPAENHCAGWQVKQLVKMIQLHTGVLGYRRITFPVQTQYVMIKVLIPRGISSKIKKGFIAGKRN
jgi:hypothetical protein